MVKAQSSLLVRAFINRLALRDIYIRMLEKWLTVRRIYGLLTGRPTNFSLIDDYVGGSACPLSKREVNWFRKKGINAILSLTESPIKTEWVDALVYKNVPMKDHAVPTLDQLREAVDFVIGQSKMKQTVVVHCMAGKGRTGTVLAAYLCEKYGLAPQESIAQLRSKRPGSVERRQVSIIQTFYESLATKE